MRAGIPEPHQNKTKCNTRVNNTAGTHLVLRVEQIVLEKMRTRALLLDNKSALGKGCQNKIGKRFIQVNTPHRREAERDAVPSASTPDFQNSLLHRENTTTSIR
jgi:hypothetical protein